MGFLFGALLNPEDQLPHFHQTLEVNDVKSNGGSLVEMAFYSGSFRAREGVPKATYICCDQ